MKMQQCLGPSTIHRYQGKNKKLKLYKNSKKEVPFGIFRFKKSCILSSCQRKLSNHVYIQTKNKNKHFV
jgi:hypothetical protein